uniref:Uncharacterized protein n=1 Tax=Arundo donax TaxID=35708 RepID=A0A0A8Y2K7_ARUDO
MQSRSRFIQLSKTKRSRLVSDANSCSVTLHKEESKQIHGDKKNRMGVHDERR